MSLRRKKWEEWKRKQIEECPPDERDDYRKLLDDVSMPTPEEERRMERIGRMIEKAFGKPVVCRPGRRRRTKGRRCRG